MIKEYGTEILVRFVLRVIPGIVFIVSGAAKMWDIYGFSNVVRGYGILPESLVVPVSIIIPFAEFVLGTMLLMSFYSRAASLLLLVMVVTSAALLGVKRFSYGVSNFKYFSGVARRKCRPCLLCLNGLFTLALLNNSLGLLGGET